MIDFDQFTQAARPVRPGSQIGASVKSVFDHASRMQCTVRRSTRQTPNGQEAPTLTIAGSERAPEDWFGVELWIPPTTTHAHLTLRNYPVHRLFPRLHFDGPGETWHVDLPDVGSSDSFVTRTFDLWEWCDDPAFWTQPIEQMRLAILVPSTPWFAMEIAEISTEENGDA